MKYFISINNNQAIFTIKDKIRHRIAVLGAFRLSVRRVLLFQREYMARMYIRMKDDGFKQLIKEFNKAYRRPMSPI